MKQLKLIVNASETWKWSVFDLNPHPKTLRRSVCALMIEIWKLRGHALTSGFC